MTFEQSIYVGAAILWLLASIHGAWALWSGFRFYRYVKRAVSASGRSRTDADCSGHRPRAAVILPCCGVDEKLEHTVQAIARQDYGDYVVIFTFESADDPAYGAVGAWTKDWDSPGRRLVVAGLADRRSQKIHNLLAAVAQVPGDREVLVFLDSDAVPEGDCLAHLVAPLQDRSIGAATGYRWYTATGGLAAGVRCAWNAATVTLLDDEKVNFCWGGATAIRRDTFDTLDVGRYWDRALSDDYQMTRAVRDAGLRIRFVPQALVPSSDRTTLRRFWSFARRQVLISRICAPAVWRAGVLLTCNFVLGGTAMAGLLLFAAMGWFGGRAAMYGALAGWLSILALASGKALLRQLALRRVLHPPHLTWRDAAWDIIGTVAFSGLLHLALFAVSLTSRRIVWRHTEYELVSAGETRVLRRIGIGTEA